MSLRERKKLAAWWAIRAAALRLFEERGFEAVSVEEIAAAADVSRSTFFNYFASKEAVVFDPDPEERDHWQALMQARPADEPLWDSLTAILIGFNERLRDRILMQRRLRERSPALAQSSLNQSSWAIVDAQFLADLRAWAASRTPEGGATTAILQINLAATAQATAYQTWPSGASFDDYLQRLRRCLHQARPGMAKGPTSVPDV